MTCVDAFATEPHYLDHITPLWRSLQNLELVGNLFVAEHLQEYAWRRYGLETRSDYWRDPGHDWLIVAGYIDQKVSHHPNVIYLEHGAGQTYGKDNPSYSGGPGRDHWRLLLAPNAHVAAQHPEGVAVGCPKLDRWIERPPHAHHWPIVCVSWHWDAAPANSHLPPEAGTAWHEFKDTVLPELIEQCDANGLELIGHAHPRIQSEIFPIYERYGIATVELFDEVLRRADVYVCDNSSTIYEFAAVGRPVALMDPPSYRADVHHGLRFWDLSDIGPHIRRDRDVGAALDACLNESSAQRARREQVSHIVYAHLGEATATCTKAVLETLGCG